MYYEYQYTNLPITGVYEQSVFRVRPMHACFCITSVKFLPWSSYAILYILLLLSTVAKQKQKTFGRITTSNLLPDWSILLLFKTFYMRSAETNFFASCSKIIDYDVIDITWAFRLHFLFFRSILSPLLHAFGPV